MASSTRAKQSMPQTPRKRHQQRAGGRFFFLIIAIFVIAIVGAVVWFSLHVARPRNKLAAHVKQMQEQGLLLQLQGDLDGAAASFESVLRDDPNNPDALFSLGSLYRWRRARSAEAMRKYVQIRPDDTRGWLLLAQAEAWCHEPRRAVDAISRYISANPADADAYLLRADQAANAGGNDQQILDDAQKVLSLRGEHPLALYLIGKVLFERGQYPSALDALSHSIALYGNDSAARAPLFLRGQTLLRMNRQADAQRDLRAAEQLQNQRVRAYEQGADPQHPGTRGGGR